MAAAIATAMAVSVTGAPGGGIIPAAVGFHHGEADPTLLGWIMTALSHILLGRLGFTELTVVIIIGMIILAMPALIVVAYLVNEGRIGGSRRKRSGVSG